jgi:GT2 family glycosyltransferase
LENDFIGKENSVVIMTSGLLAVLIATRNRPQNLLRALESIAASGSVPTVVIVISSGNDVSQIINSPEWPFLIIHEHILGYGQIRQKQAGIALIPPYIQWTLFMDDDILLDPQAITNALSMIQFSSEPILGIGFGSNSKKRSLNFESRLGSKRLGKVTSDGRNLDYTLSKESISTEWLNGISMWDRSVLHLYDFPYLDSKYSICEDLIFSYTVSRFGKIVYAPSCQFAFQLDEPKLVNSFDEFRANAYWRLYFVLSNPRLSERKYLFVQFYRTVKFLLVKNSHDVRRLDICLIYLDLIRIVLKRIDPILMLRSRKV